MEESTIKPYVLKPEDAASYTSISKSKMYDLIHSGEIPSLHIGSRLAIRVCDLEAWIDNAIEEWG